MAKRKSAARDDDDDADLVHVWLPLFEAHVLLSIASELVGDQHYYERALALITAARPHLDAALKLIERLRERPRTRGAT